MKNSYYGSCPVMYDTVNRVYLGHFKFENKVIFQEQEQNAQNPELFSLFEHYNNGSLNDVAVSFRQIDQPFHLRFFSL
jgi:hypothetical protein